MFRSSYNRGRVHRCQHAHSLLKVLTYPWLVLERIYFMREHLYPPKYRLSVHTLEREWICPWVGESVAHITILGHVCSCAFPTFMNVPNARSETPMPIPRADSFQTANQAIMGEGKGIVICLHQPLHSESLCWANSIAIPHCLSLLEMAAFFKLLSIHKNALNCN